MNVAGIKNHSSIETLQKKMLLKGKVEHLRISEACIMWILGERDGRTGLPRQSQSGDWESPRLRKESSAFNEFCDRAWGTVQLDLKNDYATVGVLIDDIVRKREILERLTQKAPLQPDDSYFRTRRNGEEELNEDQVRARRSRELGKRNAPHFTRVRELEREITAAYEKLDELQNHIIETNNGIRIICERLKNHTEQRRNAYWNATLRTHPNKAKMPVIPSPLPESEAELTYVSQHRTLEEEAIAMLTRKERLTARQGAPTQPIASGNGKEVVRHEHLQEA